MKTSNQFVVILLTFFSMFSTYAQTTVNSLQELKPYLDDNNVSVKLAPGTYTVTKDDIDNGLYTSFTIIDEREAKVLFLFEGSNSTYDFTGVTINVETVVFSAFGSYDIYEIQIIGNNNVLKNLTIVDVGSVNDNPTLRATNITMDGSQNRIEGFNVTVKGSYPYGYGDIFGKGGTKVLNHRKHSGILVRGESNHLLNTTLIHRSYGHGIFMQGSNNALIEGCYVEGVLRTTDEVLAEAGTGSPADNVDFMTVWGFKLEPGWTFSLQEDGIRDYNGGETVINGVDYSRGASNTTIIDCTVKYMRSGVTIGLGAGTQYVENVTTLGCESGFWVRDNADIVNCKGDASVGPLYSEDRERRNATIDLTLLDNDVQKFGNTPSLYLAGSGHNITLKDGTTSFDSDIEILVGGRRLAHRWLAGSVEEPPAYDANNIRFVNQTPYPVVIGANSNDNTVESCGVVSDNGSGNSISKSTDCEVIVNPPETDNLALNGAATQSSDSYNTLASFAIDGNTSGVWNDGSVTHTATEVNPWWQVDLGSNYSIDDIKVFNRTDSCCKARLTNFTVSVLNTNGNTTFSKSYTAYPDPSITVNANGAIGNIVKIQINGTNPLSLAEVEVYGSATTNGGQLVHITKRNASGFAFDGGQGGANRQAVSLQPSNTSDEDQLWVEIDRGNGYYSYQKYGTNYCIDGNGGGELNQLVYLWERNDANYNQQWQKVAVGDGGYKLIKRNATGFALNGGSGGQANRQINLWNSSNSSQNLQWVITPIVGTSVKSVAFIGTEEVIIYPNPVVSTTTISGAANTTVHIYDMNGKELITKNIINESEILDLSTLSVGMYYAKVIGLQSSSAIKIIMK